MPTPINDAQIPQNAPTYWMADAKGGDEGLAQRLLQVWNSMHKGIVLHTDLFALVRHWSLHVAGAGASQWLPMPLGQPWPGAPAWRNAGFDVVEHVKGMDIRACSVRLHWLGAQADLFDDAFAAVAARQRLDVPADAIVQRKLGLPTFTGAGQREVARALIHLPPEITLIANLPTGSGKSLLAQLAPLIDGDGHMALTIVPTVALAIDQARRMSKLLQQQVPGWQPIPLAYHGGLTHEERAQVHRAMRQGSQKMLFTSPESATGVLRESLEAAATAGRLTHVIVDEAHLVATWGQGFRPEFQLLPALIRHLRQLSENNAGRAIRVALASGTLTPASVAVLQQHFGPPSATQVVSGVHLRAEPRYAVFRCADEAARRQRVVEVLKAAPRPFILYVTRPPVAQEFLDLLRAEGFTRIAAFTGSTGPQDRERLLTAWTANQLDGMVATSAFGLGVDKADVRTIIHATMPESLDRFYQEVGRGGRDGLASVSLLIYTEEDVDQARGLSQQTLIGNELAFERWQSMIGHPVPHASATGWVWVDLERRRADIAGNSPVNRDWNLRTLNLMAMAGLVELVGLRATRPGLDIAVEEALSGAEPIYAAVRILNPEHGRKVTFAARMNEARAISNQAASAGVAAMLSVACGEVEMSTALRDLYTLNQSNAYAAVSVCCGGCAQHWKVRVDSAHYRPPYVHRIDRFSPRAVTGLSVLIPDTGLGQVRVVTHEFGHIRERAYFNLIDALLNRLNPHTVILDRADVEMWASMQARLKQLASDAFIDDIDMTGGQALEGGANEVRLVLWPSRPITPNERDWLWYSPAALTVLLIPADLRDPDRPDRVWAGVVQHIRAEAVLEEFNA